MKYTRRNCCSPVNILIFIISGLTFTFIINRFLAEKPHTGLVLDDFDDDPPPLSSVHFVGYEDYARLLKETASKDNLVILAMVDSAYLDMAYNFYYSSIMRHQIDNLMFVSLDHTVCQQLVTTFPEREVPCFVFRDLPSSGHASLYDSREFKEKIYLRRFLILEAIKLGHNILMTDLDVLFLQNPLHDVMHTCSKKKCDIAAQWDEHLEKYNPGFIYVRSNDATIKFYERLARYELSHGVGQLALNAAVREQVGHKYAAKVIPLSHKKYRIGLTLFPRHTCPDPKSLNNLIVIHNNYIIEKHNKIYRFKECMLWDWDGFDGYYSNPTRRYLSINTAGSQGYAEHQGLLNAFTIAKLLGRTVILPRLECKKPGKCSLLMRMYDHQHLHFIKRFHNATDGNYRESSFLANPRVPDAIKDSQTKLYHINFRHEPLKEKKAKEEEAVRLSPHDMEKGPTLKELIHWFGETRQKVLRFDNLVGHFAHLDYGKIVGDDFIRIIRQL